MMRINQEDIDTYVSVTGLPSSVAIQKLKELHGNICDALDAFYEADKIKSPEKFSAAPQNDVVGVDDQQSLKSTAIEVPTEAEARTGVSGHSGTRASAAINVPDETRAIEEEMILAAINASNADMDLQLELALALSVQTVAEKVTMGLNESAKVSEQEKVSIQTAAEKAAMGLNESAEVLEQEKVILKWKVTC